MWDADFQRFSRQCFATGRSLTPGERYYSALVRSATGVERRDYSVTAWESPPEGSIGWWQAVVPDPKSRRTYLAPNEVILDYFSQLPDTPETADTRYVLALFLLRKRLLRQERPPGPGELPILHLSCPKLETEFEVVEQRLSGERLAEIQRELSALLEGNDSP